MLASFVDKLNDDKDATVKSSSINKSITKNKYGIYIHKDILLPKKLKFISAEGFKNQKQNNKSYNVTNYADEDKNQYTFSKGTSISTVIDTIMSLTHLFTKQREDKKTTFFKTYKIISKVVPISPDFVFKKGFGTMEYANTEIAEDGQLRNPVNINNETNDYAKLMIYYIVPYNHFSVKKEPTIPCKQTSLELIKKLAPHTKKKYDYIFTGENDQIYDFNLNFKFSFYSSFRGLADNNDKLTLTGDEASVSQGQSKTTEGEKPNTTEPQEFKKVTAEECILEANYAAGTGSLPGLGVGIEGDPEGHRSYFNNVMSSAVKKGQPSGDMINIDLEIKGDPHWLGRPFEGKEIFRCKLPDTFGKVTQYNPCYEYGVPTIMFRAFQPEEYDDDTGLIKPAPKKSGSLINGICYLTTVTNKFSGGVFKQQLQSFRDIGIAGDDINEALANDKVERARVTEVYNDDFNAGFDGLVSNQTTPGFTPDELFGPTPGIPT